MPANLVVWLADYHLASFGVLAVTLFFGVLVGQPAKRLAMAWAAVIGLGALALPVTIPGWSLWSLATPRVEPAAAVRPTSDVVVTPLVATQTNRNPTAEAIVPAPTPPLAAPLGAEGAMSMTRLVSLAYGFGTVVAAGWLLFGWWLSRRMIAKAVAAEEPAVGVLHELTDEPPRLLVSDRLAGPVAVGLRRPTILLPRRMAERAAADELRTVLAHELAHLRGGDLWLLATLRGLLVAHWANPLFWLLRRRVRLDQETLADAAAAALSDRSSYAKRLIDWARDLGPQPTMTAAAGLWESPSQLSKRIKVLLDDGFTVLAHSSLRWRAACGVGCLALVAVASLVTLGPAGEEAADALDEEPAANEVADEADDSTVHFLAVTPSRFISIQAGEPNTISGYCLDAQGEPLAGVEVLLFHQTRTAVPAQRVADARTGGDGGFRFERVLDDPAAIDSPGWGDTDEMYHLVARRRGYATRPYTQIPYQLATTGTSIAFRLQPAATLTGRVTDSDGEPVEGARVGAQIDGSFDLGNLTMYAALTDADGRYAIHDLPKSDLAAQRRQQEQQRQLNVASGDSFFVPTLGELTVTHPRYAIAKRKLASVPGEANVRLSAPAVVEGRVVHDAGKSLEGLSVRIQTDPFAGKGRPVAPVAQTLPIDNQGRYRFATLPDGAYYAVVSGLDDRPYVVSPSGQSIAAAAGETTIVPDLVVSDGRVVRFQLIDKENRQPLRFDEAMTSRVWFYRQDEKRYGGPVPRETLVDANGQFACRIDNRAMRVVINLPIQTSDFSHDFQADVPAGEVEQPFPFLVDLSRVVSLRPGIGHVIEEVQRLATGGELDAAIDKLSRMLVGQDSTDPNLLLYRAKHLADAKRYEEAIRDYDTAIAQKPQFAFVLKSDLARLLATAEDPRFRDVPRAVELARDAVEQARDAIADASPEAASRFFEVLAVALEAAGEFDAAIEALEQAITAANDLQRLEWETRLERLREQAGDPAESAVP